MASPFPYDPNQPIPELVTLMLEHIDRLPIAEQAEGWLSLIAFLIRVMPSTQVLSLRAEIGKLPIELPRLPVLLFTPGAKTGVHRYLVQPGAESALTPELLYVSPGPDPNLLAGVLGVLGAQYPQSHPIYEPRVVPDQPRESLDVPARGPLRQAVVRKGHVKGPFTALPLWMFYHQPVPRPYHNRPIPSRQGRYCE